MIIDHAHVESSIVFDNVIVGPGARVRGAIIDKEAIVQPSLAR